MALAERIRDWMGYSDDEYYEDEEETDALQEEESYRPAARASNPGTAGREMYHVVLEQPARFEDARDIADHLNANNIVVFNLQSVPRETARRILDFLGGAAYAKNGQFKRIADSTFIITPSNVGVEDDLIESFSQESFD